MKIIRFILLLLVTIGVYLYLQSTKSSKNTEPNSADFKSIEQLILKQQDDWNRGNLLAFMEGYWQDDSMRFVSANGTRYGHANTLKAYQKHYPNKAAMGKLTFRLDRIAPLSEGSGLALASGRWQLTESTEAGGGYFSLILKKINDKWKIIADHTWADMTVSPEH
jgi:ketosteroid isomerase-like protein